MARISKGYCMKWPQPHVPIPAVQGIAEDPRLATRIAHLEIQSTAITVVACFFLVTTSFTDNLDIRRLISTLVSTYILDWDSMRQPETRQYKKCSES